MTITSRARLPVAHEWVFAGDSELARLCRAFDWGATPLGATATWSTSLRVAAQMSVAAGLPSIVLWGPELIQIYNDAYARLIRAKHPVALGRGNREVWPEVWHINGPIYERVFAGETVIFEDAYYPLLRQGAVGAWTEEDAYLTISYSPIRDELGDVGGVQATMLETTVEVQRRSAETALRASEARLRLALDVAEIGTWEIDLTTGQATLDARGAQIVGIEDQSPGDAARAQLEHVHADDLAALQQTLAEGVARGTPFSLAYRVLARDGSSRHVYSRAHVFLDEEGRPSRLMGTSRDVTAEREAEAERLRLLASERAARREAEGANRAKDEFLAVMSHELRTPLNAIGGYAELMEMGLRGPLTEQQRDDLARIQRSQRHLLSLINEVLTYAEIERGVVRYAVSEVDVRAVIEDAEALIAPLAHRRGVSLTVRDALPPRRSSTPTGPWIRGDGERVRQILVNLLSNAVKFTERGGSIEVRIDTHAGVVRIAVHDTGIGIADDQLGRIFEPFVQVRGKLTRTAEGTGLGLAISRDLARGMGGDVTVRSVPGEGSTFTLVLPGGDG